MSGNRFAIFLTTILAIWAGMHVYVFARLAAVPWIAAHLSRRGLWLVALLLCSSYPLARMLDATRLQSWTWPLEWLAANWIGALFLLFAALLLADVITLGGWLLPAHAPAVRGWAALTALVLAGIGLVQGSRSPVLREYEVRLRGLPADKDGMVMVAISDLHLGTLLGRSWLEQITRRVNALNPDLVVVVGDVVDGNVNRVEPLLPLLRQLQSPAGVWAVTGNHEFYAGIEPSVALLEKAGFKVLRDSAAELAPGLTLAGVDDLTARAQYGMDGSPTDRALAGRRPGATIFLSHSPWESEKAAAAGAGLMLSGHTHGGQVWPFSYLVANRYPLLAGRYEVGDMTVIVCRGTGTWGPRLRLWQPAEILRITLRTARA